jgi:acyl dehydratase
MIDVERAVGAELPAIEGGWAVDDVILYHLGLGAGPGELDYVFEDHLKVLPTFAVIDGMRIVDQRLKEVDALPHDPATVLHGEQTITVLRPLPVAAETITTARIAAVYDKGSAALTHVDTSTSLRDGTELFRNRFSMFMRGAGGFGGSRGPKAPIEAPSGPPDVEVRYPIAPNAAAIYRLSGDKNPLHINPAFAGRAGFSRGPILHGLCTYGMVCRAVVDELLGGDVTRVGEYWARFTGVVYPGETLVVQAWKAADAVLVEASSGGLPVLTGRVALA